MQRSPELEAMLAADHAEVRDIRARRRRFLGGVALLLGGAALAYVAVFVLARTPGDTPQDDEEFRTTTFRPPSFLRDTPKPEPKQPEVIKIPEPPLEKPTERSDTTEFNVPPPPSI